MLDWETQWKGPVVKGNQAFICSQANRGETVKPISLAG